MLFRAGSQRLGGRGISSAWVTAAVLVVTLTHPPGASAGLPSLPAVGALITVTTPGGARAVIERAPFRISFLDAHGRTVLSEAPSSSSPMAIAPVPQPEFGTIGKAVPTLYAPLGYLVGAQSTSQEPAGQFEGNLTSVTETGIVYSGQTVLDAHPQNGGVVLTVATNDPTGRRLIVSVTPGTTPDALVVDAVPTSASGVATMSDSFASAGESFFGFGGRHNNLSQRGDDFYNWLQQENVSSGSGAGLTAPASPGSDRFMFPNGQHAAYYVQSSFLSNAGYGFLLDRSEISHWRMASDRADAWQTEVAAPELRYVVVPAPADQAASQLTAVTGRQPAPPAWALGSLFDRATKYPSDPPAQYAQEVQSDIDNFDRYGLHVDGYRIEGAAELPKDVLAHLISELKSRGIHPLLYFRAFVGQDTTGTDDPKYYAEALAKGYVATHADGSPYTFVSNFNNQGAQIDFSNPAAVAWWQNRIKSALDLGADGFMQDFGEQVLTDMHFHDGSTGAQMHNRLPILYGRATRDAVNAYEASHPGRHIFYFSRAGYSGTPGNAAYENANFPGDETTDWTRSSGLASLTTDMLNRAVGGAFGFSADIGGYYDAGPYVATTKELFIRWTEWTALSPLFRLHGSLLAGVHTPWSYDAETVALYKQMLALHQRAAPLIARLWAQADATGVPITRPLWLAYPGDPASAGQDQEWLLGPDVLVAPVVTQGASSVQVHFPPGCWSEADTGARFTGPLTSQLTAPLSRLLWFVHCGTDPLGTAAQAPVKRRMPPRRACGSATGRLRGGELGFLRLGQTPSAVARASRAAGDTLKARAHGAQFLCLGGGTITIAYAHGRVAVLVSGNRHYALGRFRPGTRPSAAGLRGRQRIRIGPTSWYLLATHGVTGLVQVRSGRVSAVGVGDPRVFARRGTGPVRSLLAAVS